MDLVDAAGKPQLLYEKRTSDCSAQQVLQARQLYLVALVTRALTRTRLRLHSGLSASASLYSPVWTTSRVLFCGDWGQSKVLLKYMLMFCCAIELELNGERSARYRLMSTPPRGVDLKHEFVGVRLCLCLDGHSFD